MRHIGILAAHISANHIAGEFCSDDYIATIIHRRRIIHRRDINCHCKRSTVCRAVIHSEGEACIRITIAISDRRINQVLNLISSNIITSFYR